MRVFLAIIVVGLGVGAAIGAEFDVRQSERAFRPERLSIARVSVIRFVNDEKFIHHAFIDSPQFSADTGDIPPGEARNIVFSKAGAFVVRCAIHPQMKMIVEVSGE